MIKTDAKQDIAPDHSCIPILQSKNSTTSVTFFWLVEYLSTNQGGDAAVLFAIASATKLHFFHLIHFWRIDSTKEYLHVYHQNFNFYE